MRAGNKFIQANPSNEEIIMLNPSRIASRAAAACALALVLAFPVHAAPVLQMSAATSAAGVDLTVSARNVADLYAYQFTLNFDSTLLSGLSGTEGSFLANAGSTFFYAGDIDNVTGAFTTVFDTLVGPGNGMDGTGGLATFSFGVRQAGLANFTLSDVLLLDSTGALIPADFSDLAVAVVPEPASLWLVAIGLFAMVGGRNLRRKTA
jgi:hypothetical protein